MEKEFYRCDVFDLPAFASEHRGGPRECADKLLSEAAEVFGEVRNYADVVETHWDNGEINGVILGWAQGDIADEIADVLQVCRNICEVCGITPELMANAVGKCVVKNRRKDGGRYPKVDRA